METIEDKQVFANHDLAVDLREELDSMFRDYNKRWDLWDKMCIEHSDDKKAFELYSSYREQSKGSLSALKDFEGLLNYYKLI